MVEHDIFAFCLRRSGHTAITNWLASQVQPSYSLKDCNMTQNKLHVPVVHIIEDDELHSTIHRDDGLMFETREERPKDYRLLLSAFEDGNSIDFETDYIRRIVNRFTVVDDPKVVIVLRDPFNLFASRLWRNRENLEIPFNGRAAKWFNLQLKQFETVGDFHFIDYYYWVTNKNYRRHVTNCLKLPFTTDKFHHQQANISSFDDFDGHAVKNSFNDRWYQFLQIATKKQKKDYLILLEQIDMDLASRVFIHLDCRETYKLIKDMI